MLFSMQIYTNFESNSQRSMKSCLHRLVVFDANLYKFWKQFTTYSSITLFPSSLFSMQIYTNFESNSQPPPCLSFKAFSCFRCKFIQILKAIHNCQRRNLWRCLVVFDANLYKFWKQFTTYLDIVCKASKLFSMQIYTNFESNSQRNQRKKIKKFGCFRCKFIQILKAIHNWSRLDFFTLNVVFDANLYKFWKQFTTSIILI